MAEQKNLPTHLGFIVDGNRRWAKARGLPTLEGHRKGFKKVEMVAEKMIDKGVKFASFYLFSTENWNRSEEEVAYLMDLVRTQVVGMTKKLKKKGIRCVVLGSTKRVAKDILKKLHEAEEMTKDCTRGTIGICFNYGGHQEIAEAASAIVAERLKDPDANSEVTIEDMAAHLYHPEVPACDMIIRTSGEERISNFQLWRAAYSEFLFLKKPFPDMEESDLDMIMDEFARRNRRFGH